MEKKTFGAHNLNNTFQDNDPKDDSALFLNMIFKIRTNLVSYKKFAINTLNKKNINDYDTVILKGAQTCNLMLELIVVSITNFTVENGFVKDNSRKYSGIPILDFCTVENQYTLPPEARNFLNIIKEYKNKSITQLIVDYETVIEFTRAFDYFIVWFYDYINENEILPLDKKWGDLKDILINEKIEKRINLAKLEEHAEKTLENINTLQSQISSVNDNVKIVDNRTQRIETAIDEIAQQLRELTNQITLYQSLITRQLEKTNSENENDKIIQSFVDECVDRIVNNTNVMSEDWTFEREKRKLINSIGESAWGKLDDSSKTFLITSKAMYNDLLMVDELTDYSGVCILVTKALDLELTKRFFHGFLNFLNRVYDTDYTKYHTALLYKNGSPLNIEKFTMGNIAFALCYKENWNDTEDQKIHNKKVLLEYVKSELIINKTDNEIWDMLNDYGANIERIRIDYRNPSAHTNQLHQIHAKECFDLVLDVEKLLKKMLDSFLW